MAVDSTSLAHPGAFALCRARRDHEGKQMLLLGRGMREPCRGRVRPVYQTLGPLRAVQLHAFGQPLVSSGKSSRVFTEDRVCYLETSQFC